ncbi:MAG TPA: DUF2752 domain-containing protein [Candidatus Onthocola stercoravium]|nr:DUF2752 domain-containing protein [Candidatus Onthocola stercoravium]
MIKYSKMKLILILISFLIIYFILSELLDVGIPCLFYEITGYYCPGCGITRLLFSLLKLDFYQAFRYNPLIFILIIITVIYWLVKFILKKFMNISIEIPNYVYYILLVIVIIFGILRNIPMFDFLSPTEL